MEVAFRIVPAFSLLLGMILSCSGVPSWDQRLSTLEAELAVNPDSAELRYQMGVLWNEKAVEGDGEALDQAIAVFEALVEDHPDSHRARAFLGSCYVLKARDASVFTKMRWCRKGFVLLDDTVTDAPDDLDARLIRAINAAQVPGFLGRGKVADEDFAYLLERADDPALEANQELRRAIYYHAGDYALQQRDSKAVTLLTKARQLPGDPSLDPAINQALEDARLRFPQQFPNTENS